LLQQLNDHKVCRKCGANSETQTQPQYWGGPSQKVYHTMLYNKCTNMLEIRCWRCGFEWERQPDDAKELA